MIRKLSYWMLLLFWMLLVNQSVTPTQAAFVPETSIPVEMYVLNQYGEKVNNQLCTIKNKDMQGCTAFFTNSPAYFANNYKTISYPYTTSQPLIHVEDEYLPNVVTMELNPDVFGTGPQALRAQAIAARSYALHWFENKQESFALNNSNQHQVYVPYVTNGGEKANRFKVGKA